MRDRIVKLATLIKEAQGLRQTDLGSWGEGGFVSTNNDQTSQAGAWDYQRGLEAAIAQASKIRGNAQAF